MTPSDPIPNWLRRAEPILASRVNVKLYSTIQEMGSRVRREGFRTVRGRRYLAFRLGLPAMSLLGIGGGLYLLTVSFWLGVVVLYGTVICQQVVLARRHVFSLHENIMVPEVLKDLWLSGCRGSEIVCVPALAVARVTFWFSFVFALAAFLASLSFSHHLGLGWDETIPFVAALTTVCGVTTWWFMRLSGTLLLLFGMKQKHGHGKSNVELALAYLPLVLLMMLVSACGVTAYILLSILVDKLGGTQGLPSVLWSSLISSLLLAMYLPALSIVRRIQNRWLDHMDELFDSYVRKVLLKDPDAER
jgi:hypothetical protein